MKKIMAFGVICLFIACGVCFSGSALEPLEGASVIKVINLSGNPKIMKAGTESWADCGANMIVNSGDRIKTARDEFIEIAFAKDLANVVKIWENSDVVVKSSNHIELLNGKVLSRIQKLAPESTFEIKTPAGLCGARGTGWETETTGDRMEAAAFKDEIFMKGIDESGALKAEEIIVEEGWRGGMDKFEEPATLERVSEQEKERYNEWEKSVQEQAKTQEEAGKQEGGAPPSGGAPGAGGGGTPPAVGGEGDAPPAVGVEGGTPPAVGGEGEGGEGGGATTFGGGESTGEKEGGENVGGESTGEREGTLTERESSGFEKDSFEKDTTFERDDSRLDQLDKVVEREEQVATRSEETTGTKTETIQREEEKRLITEPVGAYSTSAN